MAKELDLEDRWVEAEVSADGSYSSLNFRKDGILLHATHHGGTTQVSRLTFRIERDQIVSNQLSAPHEERTSFSLDSQGQLTLTFNGQRTCYRRQ